MTRIRTLLPSIVVTAAILTCIIVPPGQSDAAGTTPQALAAHSNTAPALDTGGYAWVDYFRQLAGLGGVTRNATMESQEATHVRYLANHALACERDVHDELTTKIGSCGPNPYATTGGKTAANNSDITRSSASISDREAVTSWMGASFHALTILDPRLASTGYAAYYTAKPTGSKPVAWPYTAGLDVFRGRTGRYGGQVIAYPGVEAATPVLSYRVGTETPEPFTSTLATSPCRSWASKTLVSAPIIVQWPKASQANTTSGVITDLSTGTKLATCSLNAASYPAGSTANRALVGTSTQVTKAAFYYASLPFVAGHRYQLTVAGSLITTFYATTLPAPPHIWATLAIGSATPYWRDSTLGVTSHVLQLWSGPNCSGTRLGQWRTPLLLKIITGLTPGHLYSVRVSSDKPDNGSRWSGCGNFRPQ